MITRFFTIRNHNDVFDAVGQIIKASQEWEVEYKDYATRAKIEIDNLDYATLRRINSQLKEQGKISEKEFNDLQKVIKLRNFINH
jgi:arginine decarboxylase-like protein